MIDASNTFLLTCSYTKSNRWGARGEPVEYICRNVDKLWCAAGL